MRLSNIPLVGFAICFVSCSKVYVPKEPIAFENQSLRVEVTKIVDRATFFLIHSVVRNPGHQPIEIPISGLACSKGQTKGTLKRLGSGESLLKIPVMEERTVVFRCDLEQEVSELEVYGLQLFGDVVLTIDAGEQIPNIAGPIALGILSGGKYIPASRLDRYSTAADGCKRRPEADDCPIQGKHGYLLGKTEEAKRLWIEACFVYRRPSGCNFLGRYFPEEYAARRLPELKQKPPFPVDPSCPESYPGIRWVAQNCLDRNRTKNIENAKVVKCIDKAPGKIFAADCDRAVFWKTKWCEDYVDSIAPREPRTVKGCVADPNSVPDGVKNGF